MRTLPVLFLFVGLPLVADSYAPMFDYRVACLDLETGELVFDVAPGRLGRPALTLRGGALLVEAGDDGRYALDPRDGSPVEAPTTGQETGPLRSLTGNLTGGGREFVYSRGNTRHLVVREDGRERVLQRLDDFPYGLCIADELALYTFAGGVSYQDTGGGVVYAWDHRAGALRWTFRADAHIDLDPADYTTIAVDGERALVSVRQSIFALRLADGALLWHTALPAQEIRRYDSPWTTFGSVDGKLLVACYEDLFALDPERGTLLWQHDCGAFGQARPTVKDGRVYVAVR